MRKNRSIKEKLQEILVSANFALLDSFKEADSWSKMSADERYLLSLALVAQGEHQMKQGDEQEIESFSLAVRVSPEDPTLFYRQAVAYAMQEDSSCCFSLACQAFQAATTLNPSFFEAWFEWGKLFIRMGLFHHEMEYFQQADQRFQKAHETGDQVKQLPLKTDLYWYWGRSWELLAKLSGEACDFHTALEKYRLAAEYGLQKMEFWNHYGDTVIALADLLGREDLFFEAVELYRKAILSSPDYFQGWLNQAIALQKIFDLDGNENYFQRAHESFTFASERYADSFKLWLNWGELLADFGKSRNDLEKLQASLEKFQKANCCEPNNAHVLLLWGKTEMLCGGYLERIDLLRNAEEKIIKSLEINPESSEALCVYGCCLNEIGCYFSDTSYHARAIEKFRYGLSLNQSDALLWYGLALAHFAIGELRDDQVMVEKSISYYSRVIEFGEQLFPQFWNDWGVALMKLSELANNTDFILFAIEKFECAIDQQLQELSRENVDIELLYNYGCALQFLGDANEEISHYEKAIDILSKVLKINPHYSNARYNLALSLSHLGELTADPSCFDFANEHFDLLLQADPEDEMGWNDWGENFLNFIHLKHNQSSFNPREESDKLALCAQAESKFLQAIALGCTQAFYNIACLYSIEKNYSAAMHYLEKAERSGTLPSVEDLMHDEWLEGLRQTADFHTFISLLDFEQNLGDTENFST